MVLYTAQRFGAEGMNIYDGTFSFRVSSSSISSMRKGRLGWVNERSVAGRDDV